MKYHSEAELQARRLNWNLLKTFVVLAESRSVTEAAERLFLKQPTVSHALKQLESHFGKPLLERGPGHFALTPAGEALYHEAVQIHGIVVRFHTLMRDVMDEIKGHVTIAMASHITSPLLDSVLAEFHYQHPLATLSIEVSSSRKAIAKVEKRQASLAICLVYQRSDVLQYECFYRQRFALFCGPKHPLYGRENLPLDALKGQTSVSFLTDSLNDALRPVTLMRAEAGLDTRIVAASSHLEEVKRLIIAGLGVGPLPVHVVQQDIENGVLWRLPPYDNPAMIDIFLIWNPQAHMNRAEQALLGALRQCIAETDLSKRTYG